jgi:cytochrome c biogenesis protein CcmG/thiol:disulfide interchange protein DsbE
VADATARPPRHPSAVDPEVGRVRRRRRWSALVAVLTAVGCLTLLLAFGLSRDPTVIRSPLIGKTAPAFELRTLDGSRSVSSGELRGQVVVVNFWGSWCVPCREEAPILAAVAARYRAAGVSFLGVDVRDTTASARAFASRFRITYPSVSDPGSVITQDFSAQVPIAGTPTTLVIDRTGHIAGAIFGTATYSALTAILAKVR